MVNQNFCRGHLIALDKQGILAGLELQVVAQVQRGNNHAHIQRKLPANGADAGQQVAALFLVHQGDEAVAHFKLQRIEGQQGLHFFWRISRARSAVLFALFFGLGLVGGFRILVFGKAAHCIDQARDGQEGDSRQAGHKGKQQQHGRNHLERFGVKGKLGQKFLAHLGFGGGARNKQTRASGNNDGRDGGNQAVTDGQQRVGGKGRVPVHVLLGHADDDAADQVHQGDEHARVNVARNKFARTVHGAVKVCFFAQPGAAVIGLFFVNKARVEVGFDGHLFAGHGIKGKTGGHFCDTRSTRGDNNLVEDEQDHKDNPAHHITATHHKLAKRANNLARCVCAHVAVKQYKTGGGHVERQPQQGCDQQQ